MFSTLELDVRPGSGLGMFEIGTSLWNVLDTLRSLQHFFPQVDVKYDPDSPTTPIILHLRPHLDLLFSGHHQRLHTISIKKLRDPNPPLTLTYKTSILSSSEDALKRVGVSRMFGPTYPGDDLRYPGVSFSFEEESRGAAPKSPTISDDRHQEVKRIIIAQKNLDGEPRDALDEVRECPAMAGDLSRAVVKIHEGVTLQFYPSGSEPVHVMLGSTTAQDLTVDLGPPLRVHYKEDDRMTIHSRSNQAEVDEDGDYFYNYQQHGIDFLVSGSTHTVKKVVLHSNVPGTPLFQRYKRCPWDIEGRPEDDEDESPPRKRFYERVEEIHHFLAPGEAPPSMILNRTDDEDGLRLPSSTTRLFGYDGIILEATESGQVVSVMLF
ncbi:UPF0183-domain-containing protein [Trametes versicolor FP-101664 SS1]|uniref:UPF0183-domain-containing protein n=1 Tax=Trametes versicolor (strain FP-101664) TaxID=717944 RepID=UPI0004622FE4|nr:UPF0183-domain-containing protein [Trametes versicolor FP-101664 SS1]EIW62010.1 UPF0183-domain-containing protein [Trametes versicolor FP-101664 SS1]